MRINRLVAALSIAVLAACSNDKVGEYDTAVTDTAAIANAKLAEPTLTDANILGFLDEASVADSSFGKIASTKGTSADVRAYAVMMMNDHHALRKQGQDLAAKLGVTPTAPANDSLPIKAQKFTDSLNVLPKGAVFDRSYIALEVSTHQTVLGFIDEALGTAQSAELKDLLTKARPNIEAHLKRAQDIETRLGAVATP